MNIQEIIVTLLLAIALIYLGRKLYKSLFSSQCDKGCGSACNADFKQKATDSSRNSQ